MEADFSSTEEKYSKTQNLLYVKHYRGGYSSALEKYIPKLKLLLKEETAKDLPDEDCSCSSAYTNPKCLVHGK